VKFQILLLGAILCLGASAQGQTSSQSTKSTQSANRMKRAVPGVAQSVTGCVDEQNGHYVLRDVQTSQLVSLQPAGTGDDSAFAKFVGHMVQVDGTKSSGSLTVTHIGQVADMCGSGK
jgi:hypothetical protein